MQDRPVNQTLNAKPEELHKELFPFEVAIEEFVPGSGPELISSDSKQLSYTGVLIPRFPSHQIKGDLKNILPAWIKQVCISYGWKMEFASPELEYLQWGVTAKTEANPAELIRITRMELSKIIFDEFPRFTRENLGNDFWAEGYMILAGARPGPGQLIEQFIKTVRHQQGIT